MVEVRVRRPGGRVLVADDVGDPAGRAVVHLHGTPDSRLARHPDDGIAARLGVRLLALDRAGYGDSTRAPTSTPGDQADDVVTVLDALGLARAAILGWSGGALVALACAARHPERVTVVGVASGLVPAEAFDDPDVAAAAPGRAELVALARDGRAGEVATEIAPLLAPQPCDAVLAREHRREQLDPVTAAEQARIPRAPERLDAALVHAVAPGLAGAEADLRSQLEPGLVDVAAIERPVRLWYGTADPVAPPAFGRWYASRLARARLEEVAGAGHGLLLTRWADVLAALAART